MFQLSKLPIQHFLVGRVLSVLDFSSKFARFQLKSLDAGNGIGFRIINGTHSNLLIT